MPKEGLEPSRAYAQQILSLPCIPFSPLRLLASNMSKNNLFVSTIPLYFKECFLKNIFEIIFTFFVREVGLEPTTQKVTVS